MAVGLLMGLTTFPEGAAQDFYVERTAPDHGAADVPLETTIVFEYNRAPGYSTSDWNTAVVEPREKVRITNVELCLGEDPCSSGDEPRYVRYRVEHEPDTDYTWMIYSTRAIDNATGDTLRMREPYVLRYSTASSAGARAVAGRVETAPQEALSSETQELLEALARRAMDEELATAPRHEPLPEAPQTSPGPLALESPPAASTGPAPDDHTLVLLLESFSLEEKDWVVRAGTVIPGDRGPFEIDHVRDGTYWPVAVRFADRERAAIEAIGFYDEDGDRTPDTITVEGEAATDLPITLFDFPLATARAGLGLALTEALSQADNQQLIEIQSGYGARPEGTAYDWHYRFHSLDTGRSTTVTVSPFATRLKTAPPDDVEAAAATLPSAFIDTDEALALTLDDGGQAFIDENAYRPGNLTTNIRGAFFEENDATPFWHVRLTGRTAQETKTFERYVAMTSDEVREEIEALTAPAEEPVPTISAKPNYPNPFSDETWIPLSLEEKTTVTLEVYDVLGRRVDTVLEAKLLPAGRHTVRWAAGSLPSGTYYYRVRAGTEVFTHGMTLHR